MTLSEILEALSRTKAELKALMNGRKPDDLDDADLERATALSDELKKLDAQKADCEAKRLAREAQMNGLAGTLAGIKPQAPRAALNRIEVGENLLAKDPKKGYENPRDFLLDVYHDSIGRSDRVRNRDGLSILRATAGSDEQSTFSDPYGGYLIPTGLAPGVMATTPSTDPFSQYTTKVPMEQRKLVFNVLDDKNHTSSVAGGLLVYRRAEADSVSATRMAFKQLTLEAYALMGLAYATEEILMESPVSFAALLSQGFASAFAGKIIEERLNGTGVGQFLGVNSSDCKIDVAKETGQASGTIVYQNCIKMLARLYRRGGGTPIWVVNETCLPQLMQMAIVVGTGGVPAWQFSAREGAPNTLLGFPVVTSEYCAAVGTVGDIILGDWSQYLDGTYQPLQSAESIHVRFETHERAFKFWLDNAGAPAWLSTYTPKRGSTLAPFVRLATR